MSWSVQPIAASLSTWSSGSLVRGGPLRFGFGFRFAWFPAEVSLFAGGFCPPLGFCFSAIQSSLDVPRDCLHQWRWHAVGDPLDPQSPVGELEVVREAADPDRFPQRDMPPPVWMDDAGPSSLAGDRPAYSVPVGPDK